VPVTASAGVATYPEQAADAPALFRAADAALYRAKEQGRDRTVQAGRRRSTAVAAGARSPRQHARATAASRPISARPGSR